MRRPLLALAALACVFPATAGAALPLPSCEADAVTATTASAVRSAVAANKNVCVTANVGDVDLSALPSSTVRYVGTSDAGAMGHVLIDSSSQITLRARFRSTAISWSNHITIEQSRIGGTSTNRTLDQLIFVPNKSDDLTIRDNDIGWTTADSSGNTGYGIRAYRDHDRLRIERNYIHHIGGDGIQLGLDGQDVVVDRNEIAYVAPPPTSDEHSDDIQITGNGPNTQITNNYLHHNGWLDATTPSGGSGPYIHAGESNGSLLFANNLIVDERNFMQVGGLGTGGTTRSNLTFRRNTIVRTGQMWTSSADLEWDLWGGSGNVLERNAIGRLAIIDPTPTHTLIRDNVTGDDVVLDAAGNCTSAACNPTSQEPTGFRMPTGVHWGPSTEPVPTPPLPQCADGQDNDSDGKTDLADPGCSGSTDDEETDSTSAPVGGISLFTSTDAPAHSSIDDIHAVELGVKFKASVDGKVTAVRFYKGVGHTGTHRGRLWTATGTKLAEVTYTNETASGWQEAKLSTPVAISAGQTYVASYHAPNGGYAYTGSFFDEAYANGVLSAPAGAGVYVYGSGGFPTSTYDSANYWVDVVFEEGSIGPPTASYTYSPSSPLTGQEVTFDASGSSCPSGPCSYTWEDDGPDGAGGYQWPLGTGAVLRFRFSGAGYKHVRLIVRDSRGRSASTVETIAVR